MREEGDGYDRFFSRVMGPPLNVGRFAECGLRILGSDSNTFFLFASWFFLALLLQRGKGDL